MNFFGHAVAATWKRSTPRFVLGAMLPDFAAMAGGSIESVDAPDLAAGIEWHHLTDAVFHRLAAFRRWSRDLTARLAGRGVARGASLAAGHVGVELLLDGVLVDRRAEIGAIYREALDAVDAVAGRIRWRRPAPELGRLATTLSRRGLPVGYRDPEVVASRVVRVLSRRPRLAMPVEQAPLLAAELTALRPAVDAGFGDLLVALEAGLSGG